MPELVPSLVLASLAGLAGILLYRLVERLRFLSRLIRETGGERPIERLSKPFLLTLLAGLPLALQSSLGPDFEAEFLPWRPLVVASFGIGATWFVATALSLVAQALLASHDMGVQDNLRARRAHTQTRVLLRIGTILVVLIGLGLTAATFPAVQRLGTGLLASAGLAGLVIGLAAQRTISNFLAGIQIALTQPIRLDDAVVIDGEWGWIEDITTTYVVVKIWDERRLIVPFSTLLEQPFQNWTRSRADLLGSIMLWLDYRVPLPRLRQELHTIVEQSDLWDGRVANLQVVDCNDRAIQVRALVSASTSPRAWDLRCFVREKLLTFLAQEHPESLPTLRGSFETTEMQKQQPAPKVDDEALTEPETGGLPGEPESASDPDTLTPPLSATDPDRVTVR